jgi:hypothetical protein
MIKHKTFQEYSSLQQCYELHMSLLIRGRKFDPNTTCFASALSTAVGWLQENKKEIIPGLGAAYATFFKTFLVTPDLSQTQLKALFKFCRLIEADLKWIQGINKPHILYDNLALMHHCTESVLFLLEQR